MWDDPIVMETRELRDQIASRFNYDVLALGEYFKTKRAQDAKKLVTQAAKPKQKGRVRLRKPPMVSPKSPQAVRV